MNKKIIFGLVISFVVFGVFEVTAQTDQRMHGYNGTAWVPLEVNGSGTLKTDVNVTDVSWKSLQDFPGGCPDGQLVQGIGGTLVCADDSGADNASLNYVYNGSEFIGMKATADGRVRFDINSLSVEKSLTNFTGSDSILVDYIYPRTTPSVFLENLTVLKDVHILGTLYGGSPLKVGGDLQLTGNLTDISGNVVIGNDGTGNLTAEDSFLTDYIYSRTNPFTRIKNLSVTQDIRTLGKFYGDGSALTGVATTTDLSNYATTNESEEFAAELNISGDLNLKGSGLTNCSGKLITDANGNVTCGTDASTNVSLNYVYNGSNFVEAKSTADGILQLDISSISAEEALTNFTVQDSLPVDYIYANSNPSTSIENLTVLKDIRVLGNSYLGSFTIEDDLVIGSNNVSSTNIGIGTLNPSVKLDVQGNISSEGSLDISSGGFFFDNETNYIGIGTDNPQEMIHLSGVNNPNIRLEDDGGSDWDIRVGSNTDFVITDNDNGGANRFYIAAGANNNQLYLAGDGNVGIGTAGPSSKFEVIGTSGDLLNVSNTSESHLYVDNLGNVGLGTSSPSEPFTLSVGSGDGLRIEQDLNGTVVAQLQNDGGSTGAFFNLYDGSGSQVISFDAEGGDSWFNVPGGNVGIGTTSPSAKLEVVLDNQKDVPNTPSFNSSYFTIGQGGASDGNVFITYDQTSDIGHIGALHPGAAWRSLKFSAADFEFLSGATNSAIMIDNNGNVGIGTTSPSNAIDVDGGAGRGVVEIDGGTGGCIAIRDTDDAGWTYCTTLDGTLSCSTSACDA